MLFPTALVGDSANVLIVANLIENAVRSWNTPSAAFALAFSEANNMIVVGHADRCVRLYDPRQCEEKIVAATFRGHSSKISRSAAFVGFLLRVLLGAVVGVALSARDTNELLSCSYDGSVRVWDIRSSKALHVLDAANPGEKVLAVHCTAAQLVVCGGSDTMLRFHRL
jgi:ribosome biogenesis protein YTM1